MDFGFTDEQQAIKETAHEMLAARSRFGQVREAAEARAYDDALWAEICELGWPGIAIAEEHGGQGLGMVELAILCEELGYACAPTPFLSNASRGPVHRPRRQRRAARALAARDRLGRGARRGRRSSRGPTTSSRTPRAPRVLVLNDGRSRRAGRGGRAPRSSPSS